ncbi:MAG TPA: hypothetical protein ENJ87_10855 [Gammaproteobacteria bacterium]|nr:hypothetical protein [Gammaproteobacteria bacterium]
MLFTVRSKSPLGRLSQLGLLVSILAPAFVVQAKTPEAASDSTALEATGEIKQQQVYDYPKWPERKQATREIVPPPPPGPYMSSALIGGTIKAPSFGNRIKKSEMAVGPSGFSMNNFSPDVPWPTDMKPPSRWKPKNGYHYVESPVKKNTQRDVRTGGYGYRPQPEASMRRPGMQFGQNPMNNSGNQPGMRWSNRRLNGNMPVSRGPSMRPPVGAAQVRPYSGRPDSYALNRGPSRSMTPRQGFSQ